jgi:hypothetical protein
MAEATANQRLLFAPLSYLCLQAVETENGIKRGIFRLGNNRQFCDNKDDKPPSTLCIGARGECLKFPWMVLAILRLKHVSCEQDIVTLLDALNVAFGRKVNKWISRQTELFFALFHN